MIRAAGKPLGGSLVSFACVCSERCLDQRAKVPGAFFEMRNAVQSRIASLFLVALSVHGCKDSDKAEIPVEAVQLGSTRPPVANSCEGGTHGGASPGATPDAATSTGVGNGPGENSSAEAPQPDLGIPIDPLCEGRNNGAFCGDYAVCIDQRCMPSVCGDGIWHKGLEECEDGNREPNDGCHACFLERCGDGLIHPGEACDDGNNIRTDSCNHQCQRTEQNLCGNGVVEGNEECDDGNLVNDDACRNDCRFYAPEKCGNGTVDPGETCDDGNLRENDGCGPSCQLERCGDGFVSARTEQCDDGNRVNGDGCSAKCKVETPVCGNAVIDPGEECDDGNNRNGDDCPNDCKNAVCADGVIEGRESCDDGNRVDGDGCSAECVKETRCGNGIVEFLVGGEHCDDGNDDNFDRCPNNCKVPICGDGVRNGAFEECDGDDAPAGKNCDDTCHIKPLCGNGIVERSVRYPGTSELCDDGNTKDGDNCAADCRGIDLSKCGDGIVQPELGEQCELGPEPTGPSKELEAARRPFLCHQCQWTFFDQACSECVAENVRVKSATIDGLCTANDAGPCREVVDCYVEQRCMDNRLGALPCVCGDLDASACQKAESFPGVCHPVALSRSFRVGDEKRVLLKVAQRFFTGFTNPEYVYGRAGRFAVSMARFCSTPCARYLSPSVTD